MKVYFTIPGEPQGKGRPRFTKVGSYVKAYTPDKTAAYENLVKLEYERQCKGVRFADSECLDLTIFAHYGIPKSASKKKKAMMLDGTIRPSKKPDMDNVVKVIADSLNNVAYKDDTQIVDATVRKFYSDVPRVTVFIKTVKGELFERSLEKMNKAYLSGYIASEIELKQTTQGIPVVSFQLAVKRPRSKNDETDFISIVCWRNTAEFVSKYFHKGSGIEISGSLTVRKWEDKNGDARYSTEVVADEVDFGKRSKDEKQQDAAEQKETNAAMEELSDEDPPF